MSKPSSTTPSRSTAIAAPSAVPASADVARADATNRLVFEAIALARRLLVRTVEMVHPRALFLAAVVGGSAACGATSPVASSATEATRYLSDVQSRRAALESELVNPNNGYSRLRLAHYAGGDSAWDALPEWNPRTEPVTPADLDAGTAFRSTVSSSAQALAIDADENDDAAMRTLGEAAFFGYPAQLAPYAVVALASRATATSYGVWIDDGGARAGGFVRVELPGSSATLSLTCATCHSAMTARGLAIGDGSDTLDIGRMIGDAGASTDVWRSWGRGRIDVTTSDGTAPERIPDLRPTRWLTHLHQEATVAQQSRTSLAIRLETLIITAHSQGIRPPRVVTWALATYLTSLADALPSTTPASEAATRGAQTFAAQCDSCHAGEGMTGLPIALAVVGTDPAIGLSADRGTGMYRVPSLRGVGTRGLLLHDASLPSLDAMFDPTRTTAVFSGGTRGAGAIPGHVYGLDLDAATRSDLVAYLRQL